jgi:SAM-dependent methyltransferase
MPDMGCHTVSVRRSSPPTRRGIEPALTRLRARIRSRRTDETALDSYVDGAEINGLVAADDPPLPPARLRVLVSGSHDGVDFLVEGRRQASIVAAAAREGGVPIESGVVLADVGCGSGRLLRHWVASGPTILAGDPNEAMLDWVGSHLPVRPFAIGTDPPLAVDTSSVDLVVAYSVLTHLPPDEQKLWFDDWRRIARPGGLIICTTHGPGRRGELSWLERRRFDRGDAVVRHPSASGSNLCSSFLPDAAARELFSAVEILDRIEPTPDHPWDQDVWVLRR